MEIRVSACDLGLSGGSYGACGLRTDASGSESSLTLRQSAARGVAGMGFGLLATLLARRRWTRPPAAMAGWFGVSHLVAAATRFDGCPELGAIPSLVLRRGVATECGPWECLDRRLRLAGS